MSTSNIKVLKNIKIGKNEKKRRLEDIPISSELAASINDLSRTLLKDVFINKAEEVWTNAESVLKLVGMGAFLAAAIVTPNITRVFKPLSYDPKEKDVWKRFNIPYLKRKLKRLERQKLVVIKNVGGETQIEITNSGQKRILKFALEKLAVKKPKVWSGHWYLVSYDVPNSLSHLRAVIREYFRAWGFYPIQESVYLHAYPCEQVIAFFREYLGIADCVRIFQVSKIEDDAEFRKYFDID